ncbi:Repressor of RNA polymerase III transcription [Plasmodium coatneyi]|uniref:Repressor of RNA polymerase III transcription n=1 Tax=Plasmodium coatneyi TaxID=208452 RepID=A0A1B1DVF6_9APIC|nr:Repressor of RNA polymerase III transcription [Plasmodium coatneyi]ANQ06763.1 Repressor of RNA polymerase III transcription [Plasmodium coatneyi]
MINLDIANLNDVNLILERLEAHDRFIEAKIELFEEIDQPPHSYSASVGANLTADGNNSKEVTPSSVQTPTSVGTSADTNNTTDCSSKRGSHKTSIKKKVPEVINTKEKKNILTNVINILNYVFPDYEFKFLNKSNLKQIKNMNTVIDNINYNLFYVIENIYRGFNKRIWKILKELIDFKHCDVYTYLNDTDNDPYVDKESISSFNYFFFAKKNRRILFISCITKPKYKHQNDEDFNNIFLGIQDEPSINNQNAYDEENSSS